MGQLAETFYQVMIRERVFAFLTMWSFVNPFKALGMGLSEVEVFQGNSVIFMTNFHKIIP